MKKVKKIVAILLAAVCVLTFPMSVFAVSMQDGAEALRAQFKSGEGPVKGKFSIDYSYFSPVKQNDKTKYPLVVWLHGMGDGSQPGKQIEKSNIAYWSSEEFQSRFGSAGGAFIFAARSREENGIFWSNEMIEPLRAAIDEFVAENKENIDLSRIYIGGYSMGGKMTYKMIIAFPEMFAAAFPCCPAWAPSEELIKNISQIPVWLTSSTKDPLVNYYLEVLPTWNKIIAASSVAEECRFSTITKVCYEDGKRTSSSHHVWFAVNHDMFTDKNGDYHYMNTVNGKGEEITLTYPDGMISWLCSHTSNYDGSAGSGTGNIKSDDKTDNFIAAESICDFIQDIINAVSLIIKR